MKSPDYTVLGALTVEGQRHRLFLIREQEIGDVVEIGRAANGKEWTFLVAKAGTPIAEEFWRRTADWRRTAEKLEPLVPLPSFDEEGSA